MRSWSRWMLIGVLVVNSVVATFLIGSATASAEAAAAQPTATGTVASPDDDADPSREALLLLGRELAERAERLAQREEEFEELRRGEEVRLRAGLSAPEAELAPAGETSPPPEPEPESEPEETVDPAFARLSKAYENMDPESAALALKELAAMDRDAVVELIIDWPPRTSGAILDALTQLQPALAARLSYEIWKRNGKNTPPAADAGR